VRILPVNEAGRGALVGRVGSSDAARPFLIGPRASIKAPVDGRLFLGINAAANDQPEGSFHVIIVLLQAFIFMMLTIVYIAMAHEHH
jgi:hypothetical protein